MLIEASYFRYPGCVAWDNLAVIGLVLMVSGLAIRTWAVMTLGSFFTWHIATQADQKVITSGPYAFVRHPGYFGPFLTYVGTTIFFHSWIACFLSVVFLLFAFLRRIHHEEKELTVVLGREYADYCRAVKRFIPFVW
jgi:protein-S-isoprenylcysteine O-methyltransferase Ste14